MPDQLANPDRRLIMGGSARTLTLAGVAVLMGSSFAGMAKADPKQDVQVLNAAIGLEHEGIAAYQIAATSGLLTPDVLKVGITFQGHHKQHRDELIAAVHKLGGTPVESKPLADYAKALNAASLKTQTDVLKLALGLERGAANAYLGLIPSLDATDLHLLAARLAGDEAFHAAVLGGALGEPIPAKGLMFG